MNTFRPAVTGLLASLLCLATASAPAAETLLVVRKSADALDLVDPGSGLRLATVAVGYAPHEVAVAPDGRHALVSNYGTRERPGTTVSVVDLAAARELHRIELSQARPHGVAWHAADRAVVTTEAPDGVVVVDPLGGKVVAAHQTGQSVSHMVAVAPSGDTAYVANIGSGTVSVVPLTGGDPPRTVATGEGTEGIGVTPDGRQAWATARKEGAVVVFDARTLEVIERLPLPGIPIRAVLSPDGATAYVTCAGSSELVAYDVATRRERARRRIEVPLAPDAGSRPFATIAPGSSLPIGLAVSPGGQHVYVASTMGDRVVQLDARTLEVVRTIEVGGEPDGLALTTVMPQARCHACAPDAG